MVLFSSQKEYFCLQKTGEYVYPVVSCRDVTNVIDVTLAHLVHVDGPYQIECDGQLGGSFVWNDCGLELTFPPKCSQQNIKVTMSTFLPIRNEVHSGVLIVSAVYRFSCNVKHFDKPFTLCLQHCINLQSSKDCHKMFFVTQHDDRIDISCGRFEVGTFHGTLNLNKFCIKYICWSCKGKYPGIPVRVVPLDNCGDHSSKSNSVKVASSQLSGSTEIPLNVPHDNQRSSSNQCHSGTSSLPSSIDRYTDNMKNVQGEIEFPPWSYEGMLALPRGHSKLVKWNGIYSIYTNLPAWRIVSIAIYIYIRIYIGSYNNKHSTYVCIIIMLIICVKQSTYLRTYA